MSPAACPEQRPAARGSAGSCFSHAITYAHISLCRPVTLPLPRELKKQNKTTTHTLLLGNSSHFPLHPLHTRCVSYTAIRDVFICDRIPFLTHIQPTCSSHLSNWHSGKQDGKVCPAARPSGEFENKWDTRQSHQPWRAMHYSTKMQSFIQKPCNFHLPILLNINLSLYMPKLCQKGTL